MVFTGFLAGSFFSCANNEDDEVIEPLISIDNDDAFLEYSDVTYFFREYLPSYSGIDSKCFFVNDRENKCVVINSMDEFKATLSCSLVELPVIDFNLYTLIIGQYEVPSMPYFVVGQNIKLKSEDLELNITADRTDGQYAAFSRMYYWGLYHKFPQKNIIVNVNYKKT